MSRHHSLPNAECRILPIHAVGVGGVAILHRQDIRRINPPRINLPQRGVDLLCRTQQL
jgi:hypothetical protein